MAFLAENLAPIMFMALIVIVARLGLRQKWSWGFMLSVVLLACVPLLSFWSERRTTHRVLADRDGAEAIAGRAFDAATTVITVSEPVARWVAERTANPAVHAVPNGVDTRYIRPVASSAGTGVRSVPAAGDAPFTVGFVGTLKPWHGVEVLLEAFARLARTDASARLRLVGDGPQREALAAQAQRLEVADRVDLVGAVAPEEMPAELAAMDVAVAPYPQLSDFYFSPLKIYEYLAAGLPIVASDVGPCADILDGGDLGVLVTPGDVGSLAVALAGLRRDQLIRADLGRAGRDAAVARHDWSLVVSRILATLPVRESSLADDLLGRIA